jgi:hypothetical protein
MKKRLLLAAIGLSAIACWSVACHVEEQPDMSWDSMPAVHDSTSNDLAAIDPVSNHAYQQPSEDIIRGSGYSNDVIVGGLETDCPCSCGQADGISIGGNDSSSVSLSVPSTNPQINSD